MVQLDPPHPLPGRGRGIATPLIDLGESPRAPSAGMLDSNAKLLLHNLVGIDSSVRASTEPVVLPLFQLAFTPGEEVIYLPQVAPADTGPHLKLCMSMRQPG